ncbi:MAG: hypothetical protein HC798_01255, partial [Polaribacter sp.]|nr:hypothetical protein [Polaribacter sp.]
KLLQNYLIDNFIGGNMMIVADGSQQSTLDANALKSALEFNGKIGSVSIIKGENGNINKASITSKLLPNKQNWIVLASEKNITISSTINSLISLPENTTAKLFAIEKSAVYDDLDNKKLAQLGFVYVSDSF